MKRLFHFLGGINFAIVLISLTAIYVSIGTWLESSTDSHGYAAKYIYRHPAFLTLLFFFFVNILISALRRYPFEKKHLPFLITHLGLLMVILGTFIKIIYGTQGILFLMEGTGSHTILLEGTKSLHIEKRDPNTFQISQANIPIYTFSNQLKHSFTPFPNLNLKLRAYYPHSKNRIESWVKNDYAHVLGLPKIPLHTWSATKPIPHPVTIKIEEHEWQLYCLKTDDPDSCINSLNEQINKSTLCIFQTSDHIELCAMDPNEGVYRQTQTQELPSTYISYDDGFGGYSIAWKIPRTPSKNEVVKKKKECFVNKLRNFANQSDQLPLPLELLEKNCESNGFDFAQSTLLLLEYWDKQSNWLYEETEKLPKSLKELLKDFNWNGVAPEVLQAAEWTSLLFETIEPDLKVGLPPKKALEKIAMNFPFLINIDDPNEILTQFTLESMKTFRSIPSPSTVKTKEHTFRLLSLFFRLYRLHLQDILKDISIENDTFTLETMLINDPQPLAASKKMEENEPLIILQSIDTNKNQTVKLSYDRHAQGMKWPIPGQNTLIRFQPLFCDIPYHVRLKKAKKITFPNSSSSYSYECILEISDRKEGSKEAAILSLNNVHETKSGYRFYLASMGPDDEGRCQQVRLVVNHDPAKYLLTYPGGIFVTLGMFFLFWLRPYSRKN